MPGVPRALVTGGAGFLGSHLADALLKRGDEVVIYDNFSTGWPEFVNPKAQVIEGHLSSTPSLESALKGCDHVYHFAANADVRGGKENLGFRDFTQNAEATQNVLAAMQRTGCSQITFASSAVVYGEPTVIPTPETYPGVQTSTYGASKKYCEDLIHAFSAYYGFTGSIFRFVSIIGERYSHGVIFDFVKALLTHPGYLDILGDGTQRKSYLYVEDCISGILHAPRTPGTVETWNLGHDYTYAVNSMADLVVKSMEMEGVKLRFGTGKRGWIGDSPTVHLDTTKIRKFGWQPSVTIDEGVRRTVRYLLKHQYMLSRV